MCDMSLLEKGFNAYHIMTSGRKCVKKKMFGIYQNNFLIY